MRNPSCLLFLVGLLALPPVLNSQNQPPFSPTQMDCQSVEIVGVSKKAPYGFSEKKHIPVGCIRFEYLLMNKLLKGPDGEKYRLGVWVVAAPSRTRTPF